MSDRPASSAAEVQQARPRCALVTGASRGIGRGIAEHLAGLGWRLTISSRDLGALHEVAPRLVERGAASVECIAADMGDRACARALVEAHVRAHADLDVLIMNAGSGVAGSVDSYRLDRLDKAFEVNFMSPFALVQAALPHLRRTALGRPAEGAKVIALASIAGVYPEAGLAAYGASKAALISLAETVNLEEAGAGVSATAVAPGYVDTDMSAWVADRVPPAEMIGVPDVVAVIDMLLKLGPYASVPRLVLSRTGSGGFVA